MKLRKLTFPAALALLAAPALAQDGEVNLDAIDLLLGDTAVTGTAEASEAEAEMLDEDVTAAEGEDEVVADDAGTGEEAEGEEAQVSDLTRALAGYEQCAMQSGATLVGQGFSPEQAGEQAVLACSGSRAAYVNAFYFELLPRYPNMTEPEVRGLAERVAQQTDVSVARRVAEDIQNMPAEQPAVETEEETDPDA